VHPPLDHHEVEAPDDGDQDGQEGVAGAHAPSLVEIWM
jgi:hypothetical protein